MAETRMVRKYTEQAIQRAQTMSKEDYQRIKHMNKIELVHYLDQLCAAAYKNGYDEGFEKGQQVVPGTIDQPAVVDIGE